MSGKISLVAFLAFATLYCLGRLSGTACQQEGSHVLQFGNLDLAKNHLAFFMGASQKENNELASTETQKEPVRVVNQRDADLIHFQHLANHPDEKKRNPKPLKEALEHRQFVDNAVSRIGRLLFGEHQQVANAVRPPTMALVDDWDCLKSMVAIFERRCSPLKQYGLKHMRAFANFCNAHVSLSVMDEVAKITCQFENPLVA